jgi:hypothetical protein
MRMTATGCWAMRRSHVTPVWMTETAAAAAMMGEWHVYELSAVTYFI